MIMRNGLWTKGFGIGIIFLFLGINFLPNITANVINVNIDDNNINSLTMENIYKDIFIGLIKDMVKITDNHYQFKIILVFWYEFYNGEPHGHKICKNDGYLYEIEFDSKVGFIGKHFIFVAVTFEN